MDHFSHHLRQTVGHPMLAVMLGGLTLVAACSSTVPEPTRAFLAQDLPLTAAENRADVRSYRKPGFDAAAYRGVIIRPAAFSGGSSAALSPEEEADLARRLDAEMARAFATRLSLADKPGPGVLEVRSAVTAVGEPRKVLNAVTMAVLFVPATKGGAAIEAEVVDSATGEVVAALVATATGRGGPRGYLSDDLHAQQALASLADKLETLVTTGATGR